MFNIKASTIRPGRGLFATRKISKGERILADAPLLHIDKDKIARNCTEDVYHAFRKIPTGLRKQYLELNCPIKHPSLDTYWQDLVNYNLTGPALQEGLRAVTIFHSGAFALAETGYTAGKVRTTVFPRASMLAHSCVPTAIAAWNKDLMRLTVHAIKEIEQGDEITIALIGVLCAPGLRATVLQREYGFVCKCVACSRTTNAKGKLEYEPKSAERRDRYDILAEERSERSPPRPMLNILYDMLELIMEEGISGWEKGDL
jgi:hypothetical protein